MLFYNFFTCLKRSCVSIMIFPWFQSLAKYSVSYCSGFLILATFVWLFIYFWFFFAIWFWLSWFPIVLPILLGSKVHGMYCLCWQIYFINPWVTRWLEFVTVYVKTFPSKGKIIVSESTAFMFREHYSDLDSVCVSWFQHYRTNTNDWTLPTQMLPIFPSLYLYITPPIMRQSLSDPAQNKEKRDGSLSHVGKR